MARNRKDPVKPERKIDRGERNGRFTIKFSAISSFYPPRVFARGLLCLLFVLKTVSANTRGYTLPGLKCVWENDGTARWGDCKRAEVTVVRKRTSFNL